jgi:hypothetical protein
MYISIAPVGPPSPLALYESEKGKVSVNSVDVFLPRDQSFVSTLNGVVGRSVPLVYSIPFEYINSTGFIFFQPPSL